MSAKWRADSVDTRWASSTESTPGVSIKTRPGGRSDAACVKSIWRTSPLFPSVLRCSSCSVAVRRTDGCSWKWTIAESVSPCWSVTMFALVGIGLVGKTDSPVKALIMLDFPAEKWPAKAIVNSRFNSFIANLSSLSKRSWSVEGWINVASEAVASSWFDNRSSNERMQWNPFLSVIVQCITIFLVSSSFCKRQKTIRQGRGGSF